MVIAYIANGDRLIVYIVNGDSFYYGHSLHS